MATDLDPRTAAWTNADMIPASGEPLVAATYGEAIAENGGFAAYLPRMIAAQQDTLESHGATETETHNAYVQAGTYDVFASLGYSTPDSGTYGVSVNGTTIFDGPSASSAFKNGSLADVVIGTSAWVDVVFSCTGDGPGNTSLYNSGVYMRFVDADF